MPRQHIAEPRHQLVDRRQRSAEIVETQHSAAAYTAVHHLHRFTRERSLHDQPRASTVLPGSESASPTAAWATSPPTSNRPTRSAWSKGGLDQRGCAHGSGRRARPAAKPMRWNSWPACWPRRSPPPVNWRSQHSDDLPIHHHRKRTPVCCSANISTPPCTQY